jgi:hypothetical protein
VYNGNIHVDNGNMHVNNGNMHVNNGNMHVYNGNIHVNNGNIHVNNGNIHVNNGKKYVSAYNNHLYKDVIVLNIHLYHLCIMAKTTKGRIDIPQNVEKNLTLAQKVFDKHLADGNASLLNNLDEMDWGVTGTKIAECLKKHQEAEDYKRKMEEAYRERDLNLPEIQEILRASKSLLKASFPKNPKKLGEWGFMVDDTPKVKKQKE